MATGFITNTGKFKKKNFEYLRHVKRERSKLKIKNLLPYVEKQKTLIGLMQGSIMELPIKKTGINNIEYQEINENVSRTSNKEEEEI